MTPNHEQIRDALRECGGESRGTIGAGGLTPAEGGGMVLWEHWKMPDGHSVVFSHTSADTVALYAFVGEPGASVEAGVAYLRSRWGTAVSD